jgi:hypothetical protein
MTLSVNVVIEEIDDSVVYKTRQGESNNTSLHNYDTWNKGERWPVLGQNESIGPSMELVHRDSPAFIAAIGTSRTGLFCCWETA